jgi:hypothetical protein
MVFGDIHREEAPNVGDPDDLGVGELAGVAPPCEECGSEPAVGSFRGRELCADCRPDDSE